MILGVVVGTLLTCGIRWIANDDGDRAIELALDTFAVFLEWGFETFYFFLAGASALFGVHLFAQFKGVGEADAGEWGVVLGAQASSLFGVQAPSLYYG